MLRAWSIAVVVVVSVPAHADPLIVGAGVGALHDSARDSTSLGAFLRTGLQQGVALQFELARIESSGTMPSLTAMPGSSDITQSSSMMVVDLGSGKLVPTFVVGSGVDHATNIVRDNTYVHGEIGVGLELRGHGLILGADARVGDRRIVSHTERDVMVYYEPATLPEGTYRSGRISLAFEF